MWKLRLDSFSVCALSGDNGRGVTDALGGSLANAAPGPRERPVGQLLQAGNVPHGTLSHRFLCRRSAG